MYAIRSYYVIVDGSDELHQRLIALGNMEGNSFLVVPLWSDQELLGFFIMVATGEERYTQAHLELFGTIAESASIALANALAYENLLRYRDTLIDENRFLSRELQKVSTVSYNFV